MKLLIPVNQVYSEHYQILNKTQEALEFIILSLASFFIPVFISGPQLLVGIIINFVLVRQSLTQKNWKAAPTILLPSLGVFARGILFGMLTKYMIMIIPFIWAGNFVISYFSKTYVKKSFVLRIVFPAMFKTLAIFLPVLILIKLAILPGVFLKSMGLIQLITALAGSFLAIASTKFKNDRH